MSKRLIAPKLPTSTDFEVAYTVTVPQNRCELSHVLLANVANVDVKYWILHVLPDGSQDESGAVALGRVHANQGDIYLDIGTSSAIFNGRYVISSYGEITVADGAAAEAITTTPVKLNLFTTNGQAQLMTPDSDNDRITVGLDGVYLVTAQMSFSFSIGNVVIESHININQQEQAPGFHRKIGTAGDAGSASLMGLLSLSAGDQVEIFTNTVSGSGNITVIDAQLVVTRVG